jgi:hypothetical protein
MTPAGTTKSVSDEFLRFASEATQNASSTEGVLRSAISRAYYAIFLLARDQLFGSDGEALTNKVRKKLRRDFKQRSNKDLSGSHREILFAVSTKKITLSQQMGQLYEARLDADYRFSQKNLTRIPHNSWQEYAKETVELAEFLHQEAAKLTRF